MLREMAIGLALTVAGCIPLEASPVHDFGCLFSSEGDMRTGESAWEAVGPIAEQQCIGSESRFAVRPLYTRETDDRGRTTRDFLWPLATWRTWGDKTDWRFLCFFGHDENNAEPDGAYHAWFLPFLFLGRDGKGEDYGAVFPLGGKINNFFGRDEVSFALFPLYWHSELNDLRTDHVVWPFFSRTTGTDTYQIRVFPLYGFASRSNDVERSFVLWPIWSHMRDPRPKSKGTGFLLFPLCGHVKLANQETWMVLPPFFRHTRTPAGTSGACPWPFVQWQSGPQDRFYVWPLYGRRDSGNDRVTFWAWPFVWKGATKTGATERNRFRVFPVYAQESVRRGLGGVTNVTDRYVSVWPVVSYNRVSNNSQVRMLDLWPFRDTRPIERNLAPWWTLYHRTRTENSVDSRILWGMVRWSANRDGECYRSLFPLASSRVDRREDRFMEWDVLKGLLGYSRDGDGARYRLLYFLHWRRSP